MASETATALAVRKEEAVEVVPLLLVNLSGKLLVLLGIPD